MVNRLKGGDLEMADTFDKSKRSATMKSVKSSGNKSTELRLIAFFKANNISGWRSLSLFFDKSAVVYSISIFK